MHNKNEKIKKTIKKADSELTLVNEVLKREKAPVQVMKQALTQNENVEEKVAKAADDLKLVNLKSYGHDLGDQVLRLVANRLKSLVRGQDIVSRWGGDEFVCLLLEVKQNVAFLKSGLYFKKISVDYLTLRSGQFNFK